MDRSVDRKVSLPSHGLPTALEDRHGGFVWKVRSPIRRFDLDHIELIDRPGMALTALREDLQALEKCNRWLGGDALVLRYLERFMRSHRADSLSILDLGTAGADIPRAITGWARERQIPVVITAVDGNSEVLKLASEKCQNWPEIRLECHDILALPYDAASFDLVLCSTTLHHFNSADAVTILRSMHRLARRGYVVNDLCRNWLAIYATELVVRALLCSPTDRHDAVQSFRGAFTIPELQAMAKCAQLSHFHIISHHAAFRMVLEGRK